MVEEMEMMKKERMRMTERFDGAAGNVHQMGRALIQCYADYEAPIGPYS